MEVVKVLAKTDVENGIITAEEYEALIGEPYTPINQEITGDHNTQVAGNNNHVNSPATLDKAIDEIAAQRKLVEKSQEQIDRLLSIIENMNKK